MPEFTPLSALAGGALIGVAAALLLIVHGRVAGISGILNGMFTSTREERSWRIAFSAGLLGAGVFAALFLPGSVGSSPRSLITLIVGGVLVGVGTRLGSGCTSGHGVCGVGRLSPRSIVATLTFIALGMVAVRAVHLLGGGS